MRSVFFLLTFLISVNIGAVPAKRQKKTLTLADGSKLEAILYGDENLHFYASEEGRTFVLNNSGVVQEVNAQALQKIWCGRLQERNIRHQARNNKAGGNVRPKSGTKKGLVILVNFPDKELTYNPAEYHDFFNKEGYSGFGMSGSVHDYFYDQSYGMFNLTFDVIGPVTVSKESSYYGSNADEVSGRDMHPAEMVAEAINLADAMVDYSDYDWDNDGYVDQVLVMYAGYGEAQAPSRPSLIWPHEWQLSAAYYNGDGSGSLQKDGVMIDTYACSSEFRDSVGTKLDGIGTACHEFSHCLGLPDLYDTDKSDGIGFGMDLWSVMDYGMYGGQNHDGTTPAGYTSYERMFCGWLKPRQLTDPCKVYDMPALSQSPQAYILYNDANRNEYFIFENRQNTLWDKYLPGHGMLVLHVDYDARAWAENAVNGVTKHQRLTIIPADHQFKSSVNPTISDLAGDPYPGTSGNTELTGERLLGHTITDISENDGQICFTFDGGSLVGIPDALEAEDITEDGFTARWMPVSGADYYQVSFMGTTYDTENLSYTFTGLESGVTYYYKVRAVLGDISGEWSNTVSVELTDITNIKNVNAETTCQIFDLQGRSVSCPGKGIYILNRRKVVSF
ncbi:MAG: M6 family metalloprotease domain-containing protein [Bacteroidaceae bacterium]|nr:M6 family metalloprotease domain-containing protein [Bacteroidaceae bacterium]